MSPVQTFDLAALLEAFADIEHGVVTAVHCGQGCALITPDDGTPGVVADFNELAWAGPRVLHRGDRVSYRIGGTPRQAMSVHVIV
ncbi:cold shock protein [Mycolicibacterium chubuense NBB4]|uniref:Cold shock protein n=1 Tax=Mycolicibacterium chubuense (strain NBB4) TaxID=710421 RepID=I4BEY1_MYCCN|nr:cold-shock protein [Mycolicibacterium chubuense]AFM15838.1 cold shock protein [Mycolicibacterium chubuense NBB4]